MGYLLFLGGLDAADVGISIVDVFPRDTIVNELDEGAARMLSEMGPLGKLVGFGILVLEDNESVRMSAKLGSPLLESSPFRGWLDVSAESGTAD
jgi:hypothetical protein